MFKNRLLCCKQLEQRLWSDQEKIVMKKVEKSLKHWYSTGTGKTLFVLRFLNGSLRVSFLNLRFLNVMKKKVLYLMFAGFCA